MGGLQRPPFLFMRKITILPLLLVVVAACGTSQTPAAKQANRPEVRITQISGLPAAARFVEGGVSVHYAVRVHNTTTEPITLQRVGVDSVGVGAYTVSHSAEFDREIGPDKTEEVAFWAATRRAENVTGGNGPVTLRVVASFMSAKGRFEDVTVQNVSASGVVR